MSSAVRIDLAAAQYWALRCDPSFDQFCAEQEGSTLEVISFSRSCNSAGETIAQSRTVVTSANKPLPVALQALIGASRFAFDCTTTWAVDHYDREHRASFEMRPRASRGTHISGECWLECISPQVSRQMHVAHAPNESRMHPRGRLARVCTRSRSRPNSSASVLPSSRSSSGAWCAAPYQCLLLEPHVDRDTSARSPHPRLHLSRTDGKPWPPQQHGVRLHEVRAAIQHGHLHSTPQPTWPCAQCVAAQVRPLSRIGCGACPC